jgi:hypothetical protein
MVHTAVGRCLLIDRPSAQRYLNVLENILWRIFQEMPLDLNHRIMFQQDGVPEH